MATRNPLANQNSSGAHDGGNALLGDALVKLFFRDSDLSSGDYLSNEGNSYAAVLQGAAAVEDSGTHFGKALRGGGGTDGATPTPGVLADAGAVLPQAAIDDIVAAVNATASGSRVVSFVVGGQIQHANNTSSTTEYLVEMQNTSGGDDSVRMGHQTSEDGNIIFEDSSGGSDGAALTDVFNANAGARFTVAGILDGPNNQVHYVFTIDGAASVRATEPTTVDGLGVNDNIFSLFRNFPGLLEYFFVLPKAISNPEFDSIHENPYQANGVDLNDNIDPVYNIAPSLDSVSGLDVTVDAVATDETDSTVDHFAVLLANGATAPSGPEVVAGTASGGGAAIDSGSDLAITNGQEGSIVLTGSNFSTGYDVHYVVRDSSGNITTPVLIDVTTASPVPTATPAETAGDFGGTITVALTNFTQAPNDVTYHNVDISFANASTGSIDIILPARTDFVGGGAHQDTRINALQDLVIASPAENATTQVQVVPSETSGPDYYIGTAVTPSGASVLPVEAVAGDTYRVTRTAGSGVIVNPDGSTSSSSAGRAFSSVIFDESLNGGNGRWSAPLVVNYGDAAPTISGLSAVTIAENIVAISNYTITNRDGELPTLSGVDAALFDINLVSGDVFQLVWASGSDFETLGAGPHNVTINIDDGSNTDSHAVAVTLTDIQRPGIDLAALNRARAHEDNDDGDVLANRNNLVVHVTNFQGDKLLFIENHTSNASGDIANIDTAALQLTDTGFLVIDDPISGKSTSRLPITITDLGA